MTKVLEGIASIVQTTGGVGVDFKQLFEEASLAIECGSKEIFDQSSSMHDNLNESLKFLTSALDLSIEEDFSDRNQMAELISTISTTITQLETNSDTYRSLLATVSSSSNYSKRFKKASKALIRSIEAAMDISAAVIARLIRIRDNYSPSR